MGIEGLGMNALGFDEQAVAAMFTEVVRVTARELDSMAKALQRAFHSMSPMIQTASTRGWYISPGRTRPPRRAARRTHRRKVKRG